jgi:outer membrane protein assembly factor BamB
MEKAVWFLCAWFLVGVGIAIADDGEDLREAARKGDLEALQAILDRGVDINAASTYGVTALAIACDHGHEVIVEKLLQRGAEINTKDRFYRFSPLGWAAMRQHNSIVKRLIAGGASDVESVLGNAIGMQQVDLVELIANGGKLSEAGLLEAVRAARGMKARGASAETADAIVAVLEGRLTEPMKEKLAQIEKEAADAKRWTEYEGSFEHEGTLMTIKKVDGQLVASDGDPDRLLRLEQAEADRFQARGIDVEFVREGDAVVAMVWKVGENSKRYQRKSENAAPPSTPDAPSTATVQEWPDFPMDSEHWPQFRGTLSRGISRSSPIATTWNGSAGKQIAWKTPIPGLGTSSPVVWGNRIYVTTAVQASDEKGFRTGPYGDVESVESNGECSYRVLCLDLQTGQPIWERESVVEVPKVKRHAKSSHANPTPATDGNVVVAMFGGAGLYCYNTDGNLRWKRDLGMLDSGWFYDRSYQWGFGSSPCLFEGMVLVQCDVQEGSFLAALDVETGEMRWKTDRDEIPTWSSPVAFIADDGTPTVIVTGTKCTAAYHARTGERLWSMGGFSEIVVPTPQVMPQLALLTSGYAPVQPIVVMRHGARGDLKIPETVGTNTTAAGTVDVGPFVWAQGRGGPYMPTPMIVGQRIFILDNSGILTALELGSGKRLFRQRLRASNANAYTASPVSDGKHLICISEEGLAFVVAMDDAGTIVSQNELGEAVLSTPAISNGRLLIRGEKHLFCIEP